MIERRSMSFDPITIQDTSEMTPDNPLFWKIAMNVVILTKYGRFVYMRHGNGDRSSSFLATLSTIVSKLQLSFGQETRAQLRSINQGGIRMYIRRKDNYLYVWWSTKYTPQPIVQSSILFLHHQLTSCLTAQVSTIIEQHQTYDPTVNFAKGRAHHTLLQHALQNAKKCLPIHLDAIPVLPLSSTARTLLQATLKEDALPLSILMTASQVIALVKKKDTPVTPYDVLLFLILLQSHSTLAKTQVWYPICLPGIDAQQMVFCYLHYISSEVVLVMVSTDSTIFKQLSQASKRIQRRMLDAGLLLQTADAFTQTFIPPPPPKHKTPLLKHYVLRQTAEVSQMTMSSGKCMGHNEPPFQEYVHLYAQIIGKANKEGFHAEIRGEYMTGCHVEGKCVILFVASALCDMEDCRNIVVTLLKLYKEEESNIFIGKMH